MRRVPATFLPPIALDQSARAPLYRQLYEWFRSAITAGHMHPGQRLPSTRSLAAELKISRIPVSNAYDQLLAEGYLETFRGAGTRVATSIPDDTVVPPVGRPKARREPEEKFQQHASRRISRRGTVLTRLPAQSWLNIVGAFRVSLPALDEFPIGIWSRLVAKYARKRPGA